MGGAFRLPFEGRLGAEQLSGWFSLPRDREEVTQAEVDRILDKINQKGIQSLTRRERNILKRAAERL